MFIDLFIFDFAIYIFISRVTWAIVHGRSVTLPGLLMFASKAEKSTSHGEEGERLPVLGRHAHRGNLLSGGRRPVRDQ